MTEVQIDDDVAGDYYDVEDNYDQMTGICTAVVQHQAVLSGHPPVSTTCNQYWKCTTMNIKWMNGGKKHKGNIYMTIVGTELTLDQIKVCYTSIGYTLLWLSQPSAYAHGQVNKIMAPHK